MPDKLRLMIVAGEASGDRHGASLVSALRTIRPSLELEIFGSGGEHMRREGVETLVDARDVAIMGALEVIAGAGKLLRAFRSLRAAALERRPHLVLLIDWPEFNLRLARRLKRDRHRVAYYISPQIWAWRGYRLHAIKRYIERMLVILPFEREFYERAGVSVDYVGHPLLDSVEVTASREQFCTRYQLDPAQPIVALLPGSRRSEIEFILPPMLDAVQRLRDQQTLIQFLLPMASTLSRDEIEMRLGSRSEIRIIEGDTCNAIGSADLAVVASGTATLETAIIGTPLIVVYRASRLNWSIFRPMINVPFFGLPNLIAGRMIAPELLQNDVNGARLAAEISLLTGDPLRLEQQRQALALVRTQLGEARASERAAQRILDLLNV